jgi:hypothetical protein
MIRGSNPAARRRLDQPSTHRDQPRIAREIAEVDPPVCQTVTWAERGDHRLLEEVDATCPFMLAAGSAVVLKRSATASSRLGPRRRAHPYSPARADSKGLPNGSAARSPPAPAFEDQRTDTSSRLSSAIASPSCVSASCSRSRSASACEYRSSPIGVSANPSAPLDQALAELNLERANLLRNRRLRERAPRRPARTIAALRPPGR